MSVRILPSPAAVAVAAAQIMVACAQAAVARRGRFVLGLTGGRSPRALYRYLAEPGRRAELPWERTHVAWGDERCVPAPSAENNAHLADTLLLGQVPVPSHQVHRVPADLPADPAARAYEAVLRGDLFPAGQPRFDVLLLGLGDDGHVASLFPGSPALGERDRWVVGVSRQSGPDRVTLTLPVINAAAMVVLQVCGAAKGGVLRRVFAAPAGGLDLPARLVAPREGELVWLVDAEAAAALGEGAAD